MTPKEQLDLAINKIGNDSYEFTSYNSLPRTASIKEIRDAINHDIKWQMTHAEEIDMRASRAYALFAADEFFLDN